MFSAYRRPSPLLRRELLATTALTVGLGVALATGAQAQSNSYLAGIGASVGPNNATAVGPNASAGGDESFAGGYNANASGSGAVAIGSGASAQSSIRNQGIINYRAGGGNSQPINETTTGGARPSGTAVGQGSSVGNGGGVAIGYRNSAGANGFNGTAIGSNNEAYGPYGIAIGYSNTASGRSSLSLGTNNQATGDIAVALGRQSYAFGAYSFAQGFVASVYGADGIAIGRSTVAGEAGSDGLGTGSSAGNAAIGDNTLATGGAALALGSKATATSASAVAVGSGAAAANAHSVAIGAGSSALRGAISANEVFSGVALGAGNAEFSVGATGAERQVTNVAGATRATDAVNLRQLRMVGDSLAGSLGGGFDPATGAYAAPSFGYGGVPYAKATDAVQAIDTFALRYDRDGSGTRLPGIDLTRGGAVGSAVSITGLAPATLDSGAVALSQMPLRYSTAASPTTANPAVPSNDVTLVGATGGRPVGLHNVAPGDITAATSTDAVNGGQLYATNRQVAGNTAGLSGLNAGLAAGTIGLVQQDATSRTLTVGKSTDGTLVDITGTQGVRRLTGLASGLRDDDAVAFRQLRATGTALGGGASYDPVTGAFTAPSYAVGGRSYGDVGSALAASNGLAVQYVADAAGSPTGTVDLAKGGTSPVALRGVAAGRLAAGSTDAVNGDQLFSTNQQVASLSGGIAAGTIGLLRQDQATGALSLAGATGGTSLSLVNASGDARTVTGVAAGRLAAGSTEAVNGGQLYATNQQVAGNTAGLSSLNTGLANGTLGLVQQDATSRTLTVGKATDGMLVDLAGTQGTRRLAGLSAGLLDSDAATLGQLRLSGSALSTGLGGGAAYDPVTGAFTAPSYSVGGRSYSNVGGALAATNTLAVQYVADAAGNPTGAVDLARGGASPVALRGVAAGRLAAGSTEAVNGDQLSQTNQQVAANATGLAANAGGLADLRQGIVTGSIGLVRQDPASRALMVGTGTDGVLVDVANSAGAARTLTGVAPGRIASGSRDAVNGTQLYDLSQRVDSNGAAGSAFQNAVAAGTVGLVQQDATSRTLTVGKTTDGTLVDLAGTQGTRRLAGLSAGLLDSDAATLGQLRLSGSALSTGLGGGAAYDPVTGAFTAPSYAVGGRSYGDVGSALAASNGLAVQYVADAAGSPTGTVDLAKGGTSPVALRGVAAGRLAAGSTDAVNGDQLFSTNQQVADLGSGIAAGTIGLLRQDQATGALSLAGATGGTSLSLVNASGDARTVTGVAAGRLAAGSTEVVNGGQLYATNQQVARNATDIAANASGLSSLSAGLANGALGLVQQDATSRTLTVGKTTDGMLVDLAGTQGTRRLAGLSAGLLESDAATLGQLRLSGSAFTTGLGGGAAYDPVTGAFTAPSYSVGGRSYGNVGGALAATNTLAVQYVADAAGNPTGTVDLAKGGASPVAVRGVAAGRLAAGSTEAVNGNQLYQTNQQVASLSSGIAAGTIGLLRQDQATGALSIAAMTGGTSLSLVNVAGNARTVTGVAAGSLAAGSTEAVNGNQLYQTNQQVATLDTAIQQGTLGLVRQDPASRGLTVGAGTDGTTVAFADRAGAARTLTGIGAGRIAAGSQEGVNGGQIYGVTASLAASLGGGAGVAADGTLTLPRFTVQGGTYDSVGGALGSLDAAVTSLNTSGSRYVAVNSTGPAAQAKGADTVAIGPGAVAGAGRGVALGAGAVASRAGLAGATEAFSGVAVASSQGAVSVGDAGAERQITNVAGGTQDTDAVNLRQLRAVGRGLAGALGGGAGYSADGTFTAPSYAVGGQSYASVGAALGAVDTFGARYDVDPATGGRGQSMTLAGGDPNQPVLIRNVAGGLLPTDAANLGQVTQAAAQARSEANAYTDRSVAAASAAANAYTDTAVAPLQRQMTAFGSQLADLNRQVGEVRGEARRAAAIGLAAAALRFDDRPGKLSVAAGGGVWRGEGAASFGLGYTLPDGWARVNATGVAAGRDFGIGAGASFTLN